ncbi:lysophospholipid acyltransferase family protein [Effusibacillus lacus]|uniref:Lipid A biosynthesis acyltransferase n=1 Tax=Effusibacillus lacus TaxID=1348429 RepID=A0A292YJC8_9BACL|nr:lysophospholipid acyltransferase family protein [Effusibacillus lacus]TCS69791.1 KDO2-lipid IV(A) lauroyltransferase [Effusibacillus lacus]GAX88873.1 lipid A biosynthesis acyltransferase [Effusibacillus lacus]
MYNWIGTLTQDQKRLQILARWMRLVPRPLVYATLWTIGWLICLGAGSVRQQVRRNMAELLQEETPGRIARFSREYFCNLPLVLYEILLDSHTLESTKDWRFLTEGEEHLQEALRHGRGAILHTAHVGNFFYYYWYLSQKYPCLTVVTASSPEIRPLYLIFQQLGCHGLDYDETPHLELIRTLRKHLAGNGVVFLLGDFWRPAFPKATFFGRETRSPGGTAALALDQQVPVVPFYGCRIKGFRHRLCFGPPVYLHEEFERHQRTEATNRLNILMERVIRRLVPGQWFYWFNSEERWEPTEQVKGTEQVQRSEQVVRTESADRVEDGGATVA